MRELSLLILSGACVVGCGQPGAAPCNAAVSMQVVQTQVFDGCSIASGGCHTSAPFGAGLNLTRGEAYAYLLHAPSASSPGKWRVEPGSLEDSFLWHKLTGTLATDASEGVPMPRTKVVGADQWAPLSDAQLAAVRCWILSGAHDDE
jgi:hypothetical protein